MYISRKMTRVYDLIMLLGFILVCAVSLTFTYSLRTDLALHNAEKELKQSMKALVLTCAHFDQLLSERNAHNLLELRERSQNVLDYIESHQREDLFALSNIMAKQFIEGVVLISADGSIEYASSVAARSIWDKFSHNHIGLDLTKTASRSLMENIKIDGTVYNTVVSNRGDQHGLIFIYDRDDFLDGTSFGLSDILQGRRYPYCGMFFVKGRNGELVYSSNTNYNDLPEYLSRESGTQGKIISLRYGNEIWYALSSGNVNHKLFLFAPEQQIFVTRTNCMLLCVSLLGLFGIVLLIMRFIFERRTSIHWMQFKKMIEAITEICETVLFYDADHHRWHIVRLQNRHTDLFPSKPNFRSLIDTLMHIYVANEKRKETENFLNPEYLRQRLEEHKSISYEVEDHDGIWHRIRLIPVKREKNHTVPSFVLLVRNVDEERRRERELLQLLQLSDRRNKESEKSKQEFFIRFNADVRHSVNVLHGMAAEAKHKADDPVYFKAYADKMAQVSDKLLHVFNQILIKEKLDSEDLSLDQNIFDVRFLLQDVVDTVKVEAEKAGVNLQYDPYTGRRSVVKGCQLYLRRVLLSLLDNAVRFNRSNGRVVLSCREYISSGRELWLEFVICDNGLGMGKEFQKQAFEPLTKEYARVKTDDLKEDNLGLGLSVSKRLIDAMGGVITFASKKDEGSTFTIRLPFTILDEEKVTPISYEGHKVLVAEDGEVNLGEIEFLLAGYGFKIIRAVDGKQAVESFANSRPNEISLILMDLSMPIMDGCEASSRIRKLDREDARSVPIIGVTDQLFEHMRARTVDAGMNSCILKSLDEQNIKSLLQRYIAI